MHNYLIISYTYEFMWKTTDRDAPDDCLLAEVTHVHILQQVYDCNYQFAWVAVTAFITKSEFSCDGWFGRQFV